jgi:hypothetical protein
MIDESEILSRSHVQFTILFFGGAQLGMHVYAVPTQMLCTGQGKLYKFVAGKPLSWAKLAHFDVFEIHFTVRRHIRSSGGDTLRVPPNTLINIWEFRMSEAKLLLGPQRSCFWRGSIDVCNFPYLGISPHVLGISPHMLRLFNDIHGRKKVAKLRLFQTLILTEKSSYIVTF